MARPLASVLFGLALGAVLGIALCAIGALTARGASAGQPLPFLSGKATITRVTEAIGTDPGRPTVTVEAAAIADGVITGGTCQIVTVGSQAAAQLAVGSVVKIVLGGK